MGWKNLKSATKGGIIGFLIILIIGIVPTTLLYLIDIGVNPPFSKDIVIRAGFLSYALGTIINSPANFILSPFLDKADRYGGSGLFTYAKLPVVLVSLILWVGIGYLIGLIEKNSSKKQENLQKTNFITQ